MGVFTLEANQAEMRIESGLKPQCTGVGSWFELGGGATIMTHGRNNNYFSLYFTLDPLSKLSVNPKI